MNNEASSQPPTDSSAPGLHQYQIRRPQPEEVAALLAFFPDNPLGSEKIICFGAFGQPGNLPLGAAIIRPSGPNNSMGSFLVFVRPEFRRRKIGTRLICKLYELAISNRAEKLVLPRMIHQDDPDNSFYHAMGLLPERSFATYCVDIQRALAFCEPLVQRFQSDMNVEQISIQSLETLKIGDIADFFRAQFGGFVDKRLADLRAGRYDLSICCAAVHENKIIASGLARSRADVPSVMLDVIVTAPPYRNGPIPLAILAYSARLALKRNLTQCVFEADERYDRFAVGFARRCGAKAQWKRYRYSIGREQMQGWLDTKS